MGTQETKTRILDVAEALFAGQGFASTSLRDITTSAQANLAAVNYHFGSKEALLSAVFDRRLQPINRERIRLLEALEGATPKGPLDVEGVLRAFFEPAFKARVEAGDSGVRFCQLVGRMHSETNEAIRTDFLEKFRVLFERFFPAFQRALPGVPPDEVYRRMHFVVGAMAHTFVWVDKGRFRDVGEMDGDANAMLESLIRFSVAGLEAPARAPGTSEEDSR